MLLRLLPILIVIQTAPWSELLVLRTTLLHNRLRIYKDNYYLYETKADILFSHGYKKEAVKFYKKVFNKYPKNKYVQIRIFNNTEEFLLSKKKNNQILPSKEGLKKLFK